MESERIIALAALPRHARVAVAARFARRILRFADASRDERNSMVAAIRGAERAASQARRSSVRLKGPFEAPHNVVAAIINAHQVAKETGVKAHRVIDRIMKIAGAAKEVAYSFGGGTSVSLIDEAMAADVALLKQLSEQEGWTDETPVPPEVFGPLWPFGAPDGWPEEPKDDGPHVMRLEFAIPAEIDRDQADRLVAEIIERANELHHAYGGSGLRIVEGRVYEVEPALVPAGDEP